MVTCFENLTVKLHIYYIFDMHVKFCVNQILFTIRFINLFFLMYNLVYKNLKFKHLINDIIIDI